MLQFIHNIPTVFVKFILVLVFSLLIGLEQRRHYITLDFEKLFGTDRTFTLIGILGFVLYLVSPGDMLPFLGGGFVIALLLAIYYFQKIKIEQKFGFTNVITALITYCLAPLVFTQPAWLVILLVVCILVLTEIKEGLFEFSKKFDNNEFITLAKFLILAGVILPLLPDKPISAEIDISPFRIWLAIVAVSGISYCSYLLKKFVFPNAGILLTAILGGLYSSTATTLIIARKSKESPEDKLSSAAILLPTTMMYVRIYLLALFFNESIAIALLPWFLGFIVVSLIVPGYLILKHKSEDGSPVKFETDKPSNPLEFKTAIIFGFLYVFFSIATTYISAHYGKTGVDILAFVVGVTDIDPFIINLLHNNLLLSASVITVALFNAISSNNILKMCYALVLADHSIRKNIITGFGLLVASGIGASVFIYLHS